MVHSLPNVVDDVLDCKVNTTLTSCSEMTLMVEGALNHKVNKSGAVGYPGQGVLEEVLDCEITKLGMRKNVMGYCLDNVLNKNK